MRLYIWTSQPHIHTHELLRPLPHTATHSTSTYYTSSHPLSPPPPPPSVAARQPLQTSILLPLSSIRQLKTRKFARKVNEFETFFAKGFHCRSLDGGKLGFKAPSFIYFNYLVVGGCLCLCVCLGDNCACVCVWGIFLLVCVLGEGRGVFALVCVCVYFSVLDICVHLCTFTYMQSTYLLSYVYCMWVCKSICVHGCGEKCAHICIFIDEYIFAYTYIFTVCFVCVSERVYVRVHVYI